VRPTRLAGSAIAEAEVASLRIPPVQGREYPLDVVAQYGIRRWGTGQHPQSQYGPDEVVSHLIHVGVGTKLSALSGVDTCPAEKRAELVEIIRNDSCDRRNVRGHLGGRADHQTSEASFGLDSRAMDPREESSDVG